MRSRIARRIAAGVALGTVLSLAACSSREERLSKFVERAGEFEDEGQVEEALRELRSALQLDPKNADLNFRIAEILSKENNPADAALFYRETTRLDPSRSDAALAEAKLILFDDTARAQALVAKVIEREPRNATAQIRRSEVGLARGDSADALLAAQTAVELAPADGMAHMQLGIVHLARLRESAIKRETPAESIYRDAEKALLKAAELFPHGVAARVERGRLYSVWEGHGEQALAAFRDAIAVAENDENRARAAAAALHYANATRNEEFQRFALQTMVAAIPGNLPAWDELAALEERRERGGDAVYARLLETRPRDVQAHLHYAGFLFSRDRFDACFAHLEEQAKHGPEPALVLDYVVALQLRRNELEAARAAQRRLVEEHPSHPRTELATGRIALADGRNDEAADGLRRYVGMEDTAEGQRLLAVAELRRRNFAAATAAVDHALQLEGASADVETLRLKATVHAGAGEYPQVLQTLNRVARESGDLRPNDALMYAQALYETGRRPAARAYLEQILAANPNNAPARAKNDLAWLLAEEGADLERALALAQDAQKGAPDSAEIADTVGYVYFKKGLFDAALEQFERAVELSGRSGDDVQIERPEYHHHRGLALKSLGRNDEAAPAFERALKLDPEFGNADDARRELEAARTAAASGPG